MNKTILGVFRDGLCTGCGTCAAICPNNAIDITVNKEQGLYEPRLIKDRCNLCGLCRKVCPGLGFEGDQTKNNTKYHIGYSLNHDIRYNCSSGGMVTQLLIYSLEQKIIDGALVTRMKKDNPLEPEPFIARNKEEIIEASKSKYCPVPLNVALKEILNSKKGERFAVVGLPCHIDGLRKAERINRDLADKIIFHLGLVCNHVPTFHATKYLIEKYGLNPNEIKEISYRGEGWPGSMKILNKDGTYICTPQFSSDYWGVLFNSFFVPKRCGLCDNKECRNSDGSFADAWIAEIIAKDHTGSSIVVSRNNAFEKLLDKARSEKAIDLESIPEQIFLQSQSMNNVKQKAYARIRILNLLGRKIPLWNTPIPTCNLLDYFAATAFFIRNYILSKSGNYEIIRLYCSALRNASKMKHCLGGLKIINK